MAGRRFIEEEIDFEGIERGMAALKPPALELEEVLGRIRDKMVEHRKRGVSVEQLAGVLREKGIVVSPRNLKKFIETGELLGGRQRSAAAASPAPTGGGDGARSGASVGGQGDDRPGA